MDAPDNSNHPKIVTVKERQKALKKRWKKLRQRMTSRFVNRMKESNLMVECLPGVSSVPIMETRLFHMKLVHIPLDTAVDMIIFIGLFNNCGFAHLK